MVKDLNESKPNPVFTKEKGLMLAFSRSIQISEGLFYATDGIHEIMSGENEKMILRPIQVLEKGIRGQSSHHIKVNNGKRADAANSNVQIVESAVIPPDYNGVVLKYSIRFLPHALKPHACNDSKITNSYINLAREYKKSGGFEYLSQLYL